MKTFIGGHQAVTDEDFLELALGTPLDLWLGEDNETDQERAAREAAARDILADDPQLVDRVTRIAVEVIEASTPALFNVVSLPRTSTDKRRATRGAVAA